MTATPLLATIIAHATAIAAATKGNEKPDMIEKMQLFLYLNLLAFDSNESRSWVPKLDTGATQNLRRVGGLWRYRYMLEDMLHDIHP